MAKAPFQGSRDEPGVGPAFAVSERKMTRCYLISNKGVYVCVYASLCVCACMHVCEGVCICMCACAYVRVCVHAGV